MKKQEVRMVNGWRLATILLAMMIAIGAATLIGTYFVWRAEAHLTLRQARNVWTALRLTGIEYYGLGKDLYDDRTLSGLKEDAEKRVREVSGCEGYIVVLGKDTEHLEPIRMLYREGAYMVYFYLDENEYRQWEVYRAHSMFDLDSSKAEIFK